jgi:adenine deaminase
MIYALADFDLEILLRQAIDTLLGTREADLVLRGGRVVNVLTAEVHPADVAVKDAHIIKVGDCADLIGPGTQVVKAIGKFIAPGFIDAHMHFESSMLTISEFSRLSIPTGTTTLIADPHEIGNVLGPPGILAMAEETLHVPNRVFLAVPALTPDMPGLESAGYNITSGDVGTLLSYPNVIGLGEMQGFSIIQPVYAHRPDVVRDLVHSSVMAIERGMMVDGNAPELLGSELAAHILCTGGYTSCHETTTKEEAVEKLRQGVYVYIREGSTQHNLAECIRAITEDGLDSRRCVLVTDDIVAHDLLTVGHMDDVVQRAIACGIPPAQAIQMVTLNPAERLGFRDVGCLAPGMLADMVMLTDLYKMSVEAVYIGGQLVAQEGELLPFIYPYRYPDVTKNSVRRGPVNEADLAIPASGESAEVRAVGVIPDQNLTGAVVAEVPVRRGYTQPDVDADLLPIVVVGRHRPDAPIGRAFVQGMTLKAGGIAESVSHDCHNIIATGYSHKEIALAVNTVIEMQGGLALVKENTVLDRLPLPVAGLMTDRMSGPELGRKLADLYRLVEEELGCTLHDPFMHLSFLSLATSPVWKITDQGLVDVYNLRILPPLV